MCPSWDDMSIRGPLFQWGNNMKIQLSVLVWYKANIIIISLKIKLLSPWYSWEIAEYELKSKHAAFLLNTQYSGVLVGSELVSYCCLTPNEQFGSYIMARMRNIRWDGVRFLLGQQGLLNLHSASLLKQQSEGRHVAPLRHIIPIPNQTVFVLTP
jgi:hypothetical protein